ncbi:MAG TPA: toxin-activating lysine-acyltransferase [Sphingomicrobium sp.]|nr:toxin-activating lysine-acyltransferase [Sphingomicrobium sp.]
MAKSKKTGASQAGQSKSAASETAVIDHPESNGAAGEPATPDGAAPTPNPQLDPEVAKRLAAVRSQVRESFGKIVMALMMTPRYRNQTIGDLQHLVLEPLIRDRVAIAYPGNVQQSSLADMAGFAIWASVSDEVDARIREQVANGVFPIRLKPEEWNSGKINWLFDVVAGDTRATTNVIANFKQVVKEGSLRLHPLIARLVDEETLKKMGAEKIGNARAAVTN